MLLTAFFLLAAAVSASPDEMVPAVATDTCFSEVLIHISSDPVRICLNLLDTGPDSCIDVIIGGNVLSGVSLHFTRTDTTGWHYAGIIQPDSVVSPPDLRMEIITGNDGTLQRASFYTERHDTLGKRIPGMSIDSDRPVLPDTLPTASLHLRRTVHSCRPIEQPAVVVYRKYTYPPNYRRDPVYNYPERSMFHSGKSVRMPTAGSLENRAQQYIYFHCSTLAPLRFDDPEELEKNEAFRNRLKKSRPVKKKKKKKPFLRFRPLR